MELEVWYSFKNNDQGRQFESCLFSELTKLLGIQRLRTTSYRLQSNGLVEVWHRLLKSVIMCYETKNLCDVLPTICLGMRSTYKPDIKATPAELVYDTTLPGAFLHTQPTLQPNSEFIREFVNIMRDLKPTQTANHDTNALVFVHTSLYQYTHVFLRNDSVLAFFVPQTTDRMKYLTELKNTLILASTIKR